MGKKSARLQVRLEEEDVKFLHGYAERHGLTISQMIRDFIDWLRRREESSGTSSS
jgi:predicted DNA binding CopG/RHH family protein